MAILIEQCCMCGRIHRYGDFRPQAWYHFHWGKEDTEFCAKIRSGKEQEVIFARIHRTMCAEHVGSEWKRVYEMGRKQLLPQYAVPGSLNAPFPSGFFTTEEKEEFESMYRRLCAHWYGIPLNQPRALWAHVKKEEGQ